MGEDPDDDDFDTGEHCAKFETTFGVSETPKRILFTMSGIIKCPILPLQITPDNAAIMTQLPGQPCFWFTFQNLFIYQLNWGADEVMLVFNPQFLEKAAFIGWGLADSWANAGGCLDPTPSGWFGGTGVISWGPGI